MQLQVVVLGYFVIEVDNLEVKLIHTFVKPTNSMADCFFFGESLDLFYSSSMSCEINMQTLEGSKNKNQ